jgi:hypothetical protein
MKKLITLLTLTVISGFAFAKTITVTSSADSGVGTLRQAVLDASANDTIVFEDSVTTITLSSQLTFDKNLTVNGNSVENTIISVASGYHLWEFIIKEDVKVEVNYLTFRDVDVTSTCNGAVVNFGILTLANCEFTNNKTLSFSGGAGAGIYNKIGGKLYVEKCKFYNNECSVSGGALEAASNTITYISDCEFKSNIGPMGSAISNFGNMTVINSTFSENNTSSGTVVGAGYGTVYSEKGNINLINCIFKSNNGTYCSTLANNNNNAFVINTLFVNNTCTSNLSNSTIFNGIKKDFTSILTLVNNTIADNNTIGVYNDNGVVTLNNNILWNNFIDLYAINGGISSANNLIGSNNINLLDNNNGNILGTDPLFVGNGDYSLQSISPAIDAGDTSYLPDSILTDLVGNFRISGSSIDIGAYEYQKVNAVTNSSIQNKYKIYSFNRYIFIENNTDKVSIYNTIGQMISSGYGFSFLVPNEGVYIVKISDTVQKVMVK